MADLQNNKLLDWSARQVILGTVFVVSVGLLFWALYEFRVVIFLLFVAIVIGTAIRPLVEWLYRLNIPRPAGIILIYSALVITFVALALFILPLLSNQIASIRGDIPDYYQGFRTMLMESNSRVLQRIGLQLPPGLSLLTSGVTAPPTGTGQSGGTATPGESLDRVAQFFSYAGLFLRGLLSTLAVFLLAFYWTIESDRIIRGFILLLPQKRREQTRDLIATIESKLGGYIRGQIILDASIGSAALIAYLLIGLPYTLLLAIFAGIMETVPIFGPILGAIPAVFVALTADPSRVIWVLVATFAIQTLENYLLVPRVMSSSVGVNPIVTLLSLAAFGSLLGIPGAILAVPLAAIFQVLLTRFVMNMDFREEQTPAGRNQASLIRYEARDLVQDVRKHLAKKGELLNEYSDEVENTIESIANEIDLLLAEAEGVGTSE